MAAAKLSGWMSRPTARPCRPRVGGGLVDCIELVLLIGVFFVMDRRRSRASVNRSQAGIRSRRRRLGARRSFLAPRASGHPLHESSSEAQSAKTGSNPTAAHGLSAARLLIAVVSQCSQSATMPRLRPLSTPTYPQRTGSAVTAPAADHRRLSAHRQVPRPLRLSLSLGSFGDFERVF